MTKAEVGIGKTYLAKVSGKVSRVQITSASPYGGWNGRNLDTNREVRIKSARRLRRVRCGNCPSCKKLQLDKVIFTDRFKKAANTEDRVAIKAEWDAWVKELELGAECR